MSGSVVEIARTSVYTFLCIEVEGEAVRVATYPLTLAEGDFVCEHLAVHVFMLLKR